MNINACFSEYVLVYVAYGDLIKDISIKTSRLISLEN